MSRMDFTLFGLSMMTFVSEAQVLDLNALDGPANLKKVFLKVKIAPFQRTDFP